MLELDDIQHILLTRSPALTGRYEFLSFRDPAGGRAWLTAILEKVQSVREARTSVESTSCPSNALVPPEAGTSRRIARPTVVLPEPLSPTSAMPNGPRLIARLTPSTARTGPKLTRRSRTSSRMSSAMVTPLAGGRRRAARGCSRAAVPR